MPGRSFADGGASSTAWTSETRTATGTSGASVVVPRGPRSARLRGVFGGFGSSATGDGFGVGSVTGADTVVGTFAGVLPAAGVQAVRFAPAGSASPSRRA